ncbi:Hypothetical predicted protein [Paramuricea clavata]|uniref:Uncharacterized protein n=1 Tax=Paramuricea clavata TaxID=317549 RepID=A0A7D9DCC0_PARCT|nr:Hypothetical predicted protein [Paramuricea clavata]
MAVMLDGDQSAKDLEGSTFHGDERILQQAPNDNGDEPVSLQDDHSKTANQYLGHKGACRSGTKIDIGSDDDSLPESDQESEIEDYVPEIDTEKSEGELLLT